MSRFQWFLCAAPAAAPSYSGSCALASPAPSFAAAAANELRHFVFRLQVSM